MQNMNNKKGVKLLAAVMALAMVLVAGFTIIGASDESDAANMSGTSTQAIDGQTVTTGATLIVKNDISITLNGSGTVTVYIETGKTLTVTGTSGNSIALTVYPGKNLVADATSSTGTYDDTQSFAVTSLKATSLSIMATYDGTAANSRLILSGDVTGSTTPTATPGSGKILVANNKTLVYGSTINYLTYGAETKLSTTYTYYPEGADLKSVILGNNDTIIIKDASASVSFGNNIIKAVGTQCTAGLTITAGASATAYPSVSTSTLTGGSLTVTSGYFTASTTGVGTSYVNAVAIYDNATLMGYTYNIREYTDALGTIAALKYTIVGEVLQSTSYTPGTGSPITVTGKYIVDEGVTLKAGAIDGTGTLRALGTIECASASTTNREVGPSGLIKDASAPINPTATSNVNSKIDTTVTGNVTSISTSIIGTEGMTIPEGTTVTLTGNLGLNNKVLNVNGTLVISEGSSIYGTGLSTEKIVLGTNGKIVNNGKIGAVYGVNIVDVNSNSKVVKVQGVSGAEFAYKSNALTVSGDIQSIRNAAGTSKITVTDVSISGELTIGKKVTLSGTTINALKNSVITIDGELDSSIKIKEGAQITINGVINSGKTVNIEVGTYDSINNNFTAGTDVAVAVTLDKATGFTVYSKRVGTPASDDTVTYSLKAFIKGTISDGEITSSLTTIPLVTITETITVAAEEELIISENAAFKVIGTNVVVVNGNIVIKDVTSNTTKATAAPVCLGAYYEVTGTEPNAKTVGYYSDIPAAMSNIESADDKKITIKVLNLDQSITVKDGQEVDLTVRNSSNNATIGTDSVVTAEAGSKFAYQIDIVDGMVIISGDADASGSITSYASKKTGTDGTVTYAGFTVAVKNASAGDVISIGSANVGKAAVPGVSSEVRESLAIPAGVTIQVSETLNIRGNLTIPETAKLVGGTVNVYGKDSTNKSEIKVAGTLDLSNGILGGSDYVVSSTGEVITQTKIAATSMNGAYLQNTDGNYVLTSVANAVKYAKDNGIANVNVNGTYSETGAITLDGVNLLIDNLSDVTLGDITIPAGKKIVATGDLTANVIAKCGSTETTGAVSDAIVKLVKSSLTLESKKVTSASGVETYTFYINAIDGEMTIVQGTVTIDTAITASNIVTDTKFTVAEGAEFCMKNSIVIDGQKVAFVNNGTVTVKGTVDFKVTTSGKTPVIAGTLDVADQGTVNAYALDITGTVNIVKTAEENGTFNVKGNDISIGTPIASLGASASIVGPVSFDNNMYILAYAGADLSAAVMDENLIDSTEFFVNDVLYATAYARGTASIYTVNATPAITGNAIVTKAMLNEIDGVKDITDAYFLWKDVEGTSLNNTALKVGDKDAMYYTMAVSEATITVSVGSGMSLWIDGVKYASGSTPALAVGEHQVQVTINPGYKGTATITFNGQTVSNGKITVTSAMVGATNVLSATGDISIDAGETPAPADKDNGMGISDYLLIVLVILAAVLVVIVAIRMMRS